MALTLRQILEDDVDGFRAAVDLVARERKYLALLQAPPVEQVRAFVRRNIENGYPQIIAITENKVVGWSMCRLPAARYRRMLAICLWGCCPSGETRASGNGC